jgi:CheY-like chemotaxis protein
LSDGRSGLTGDRPADQGDDRRSLEQHCSCRCTRSRPPRCPSDTRSSVAPPQDQVCEHGAPRWRAIVVDWRANLRREDMPTPFRSEHIDVLFVDDDTELSKVIVSYFVRAGLTIRAASSGSEAFNLLEQFEPRVAILDYKLPDLTGLDIAFRLRGLLPALPIILMSGGVLEGLGVTSLDKAGIRLFVNKPLSLRALHQLVRQLMQ